MKTYSKILLTVVFSMWVGHLHAQETLMSEDMEMAAPEAPEAGDVTASEKQIYTIRSGDTMWDICKIVLDNPWYWPKLWSINQYILNPNLIYPGNRLVFSPSTGTSYPNLEVVAGDEDMVEVSQESKPDEGTVQKMDRAKDLLLSKNPNCAKENRSLSNCVRFLLFHQKVFVRLVR